jgi:hypothetical protein
MALDLQRAVTDLVVQILGAGAAGTPDWLLRPGRQECRGRWQLVQEIYAAVTGGSVLPDAMPENERRSVDQVLVVGGAHRILEVDEIQHFNRYRATALRRYPSDLAVAFPVDAWTAACDRKHKLEGGGFGKPKPPLFPELGGRHQQRAFRDALADILPGEYGWLPTLRIADFEVVSWIREPNRRQRMSELLASREGVL